MTREAENPEKQSNQAKSIAPLLVLENPVTAQRRVHNENTLTVMHRDISLCKGEGLICCAEDGSH